MRTLYYNGSSYALPGPSAPDGTGVASRFHSRVLEINPITFEKIWEYSVAGLERGDEVVVRAGEQGVRFLLVSGKPLEEPVAWYGPIVMNTSAELQQAIAELRAGTFIKERGQP